MKLITLSLAFVLAAFSAFADPVEGIWQTEEDDGAYAHITVAPCGANLCGVISRTFNATGEYASENIGRQLLWDMAALGAGKYGNGRIWQPSSDKIYKSKMTMDGDILKVSGCVGPICKKQTWTRVN